MDNSGKLRVAAVGDRQIVMTRSFDAPRELVFAAYVKPELLKRWLGVGGGWTMAVCEVDLRVGGAYRFAWKHAEGQELVIAGEYREINSPERLVATESWGEPWPESLTTLDLTEEAGKTTLTATIHYESKEARDGVLKSPMEQGVSASYDRLAEILREGETSGR